MASAIDDEYYVAGDMIMKRGLLYPLAHYPIGPFAGKASFITMMSFADAYRKEQRIRVDMILDDLEDRAYEIRKLVKRDLQKIFRQARAAEFWEGDLP